MVAFEEFVAARGPHLLRTAWLLTGSREDAEDLVQTALVNCYGHFERINRADGNFEGYVRRAMARSQVSAWRRLRRRPPSDPAPSKDPAEVVGLQVSVAQALALLSTRQRQVVVLRFYEDYSIEETARLLGCSEGSVKTHLHRAIQALRRTRLADELGKERRSQ
jgi:RNA polymerase sigma-70 factor (sigma-E family)